MKSIIYLLVVFFTFNCFSQTTINTQNANDATKYNSEIRLINSDNNHLFFVHKKNESIHITQFGNDHTFLNKFVLEDKFEKNYQILLASIFENELSILTSNRGITKLISTNIDLISKKVLSRYDLPKLRGEELLQTYFFEGNNYMIITSLDSQEILLRKIDTDGTVNDELFDLSSYNFKTKTSKSERLKYIFRYREQPSPETNVKKINDIFPYTLLQTSSQSKTYQIDNKVFLTLDQDISKTYLLTFDLDNMSFEVKEIPKPKFSRGNSGNSNSLINNNKLYQIVIDNNEMILEIKQLSDQKIIYNYRVNEDEPLNIKNSPIILEGAVYAKRRELDETSQFLRKVYKSDPAISVYQTNENIQLTIGASVQMASGLSDFGGIIQVAHFSSIPEILSTDENARSTYIKCLFDNNFKHLEGEVQTTIFDKIENYKKENKIKSDALETIAKFNEKYIYIFLDNKEFQFIQFD